MTRDRLHYLDALRSFSILYGILVHGATIGLSGPLALISDVSGFFRMGLFFVVSGYFAAMTHDRSDAGGFLRRRSVALLVPLVSGLILLNPVTNWLVHLWHNGGPGLGDYLVEVLDGTLPEGRGPMVWHLHLWFLVSLWVYVVLTPATVGLLRRHGGGARGLPERIAGLPGWAAVCVVAALVGLTALSMRVGYELVLEPGLTAVAWGHWVAWLIRITLYYASFFALGVVAFHHRALFERLHAISLPAIAIGLLMVLAARRLDPEGLAFEVVALLGRAMLTVALTTTLLALFRRFQSRPGWLSSMAGSVYSIYVMHYLVIYLVAFALLPFGMAQELRFFAVVALASAVLLLLHRSIIAPNRVMSFLFNGKPLTAHQAQKPRRA